MLQAIGIVSRFDQEAHDLLNLHHSFNRQKDGRPRNHRSVVPGAFRHLCRLGIGLFLHFDFVWWLMDTGHPGQVVHTLPPSCPHSIALGT